MPFVFVFHANEKTRPMGVIERVHSEKDAVLDCEGTASRIISPDFVVAIWHREPELSPDLQFGNRAGLPIGTPPT
jgi:hypothetical protein